MPDVALPDAVSGDADAPESFGPVAAHYDALMAGVPYRTWADYLARLWRRHGQSPRSVLDLACGTGTFSRLLAGRGLSVVGVDLSEGMLAVARARAEAQGLAIPFFRQDAADLDLGSDGEGTKFDAAVCLFDSLNYLLDADRLRAALGRVFSHLNPGGAFVFDVNTEYALAEGMFNQSCTRKDEPLHYRWRSRYDPETRLCVVRMNFSYDAGDGGARQTFTEIHRQRAYPKDDLARWLRGAGFAEVFVYDAYSTDPPKRRSDRLFFYAVKGME